MSDIVPSSPFQTLPSAGLPAPSTAAIAAAGSAGAAAQPARLKAAAQQFEAIFLRQILGEARKSTMGDTLFSSDAQGTFTQMQDAHFADIAASRDALGLAGLIERQLGARGGAGAGASAGIGAGAGAGPGLGSAKVGVAGSASNNRKNGGGA